MEVHGRNDSREIKETENPSVFTVEDAIKTGKEEIRDPWLVTTNSTGSSGWKELSSGERVKLVLSITVKIVVLLVFVYFFICALGFLHDAFQLLGGETSGKIFQDSAVLSNPVAGLMIGILATSLIQSSSTTISIVITMAGSKIIPVEHTIPIVMGANIGTTVTNTIVSLAQAGSREEFRKAFGGATIHDVFNWLSVLVLLPLEAISGYLYRLTKAIVSSIVYPGSSMTKKDMLKKLTKPFIGLFVKVDKSVIKELAVHGKVSNNSTVLKRWCRVGPKLLNRGFDQGNKITNITSMTNDTTVNTLKPVFKRCSSLFAQTDLTDKEVGIILTILALLLIILCLFVVVKLLNSLFRGTMASIIKRFINSDFPGKLGWLTGYVAILIGTGMTMIIQSSSIFTSTLTPLVGVGIVSLERMFPLTVGANIGTTLTGILAALAAPKSKIHLTLQVALSHLFFNLSGTCIFYPIPIIRRVPIGLAKILGNTISKYRWFSIIYLIGMFFVLPTAVFGLSLAGTVVFLSVGIPILCVLVVIIIINILQAKKPKYLPQKLQNWNFLPECLYSLEPYDRIVRKIMCKHCKRDNDLK